MPEFRVVSVSNNFKKVPVESWTAYHLSAFYCDSWVKKFKFETRWTRGQITCHINAKSIEKLLKFERKGLAIPGSELFRQFIVWIFDTVAHPNPMNLSNEGKMVEFLDSRALAETQRRLGADTEFDRLERERVAKAEAYFSRVSNKNFENFLQKKKISNKIKKEFLSRKSVI